MLVGDPRAAGDQLAAGAVAVAVGDGAVRVVVVGDGRDVAPVPVVCEEVVARGDHGLVVAWVDASAMLLYICPVSTQSTRT